MSNYRYTAIVSISGALLLLVLIYGSSVASIGPRHTGALRNIHGIPYPLEEDTIRVTEALAHTNVFLKEPVFAKELQLSITFDPGNLDQLRIGVRENEFWLSYSPYLLFDAATNETGIQTQSVIIPLTDKLQRADRSIDLMFFAVHPESGEEEYTGQTDKTQWTVYDMQVVAVPIMPSWLEIRRYGKSILWRERPL